MSGSGDGKTEWNTVKRRNDELFFWIEIESIQETNQEVFTLIFILS